MEVLPKLAYFTSKTYSRVLRYSVIETKMCQTFSVGRRKSLKTMYWRISCLHDNLKATGWRVFLTRERVNEMDKNAVSLVCTDSHRKGEVIPHVQQKSP